MNCAALDFTASSHILPSAAYFPSYTRVIKRLLWYCLTC